MEMKWLKTFIITAKYENFRKASEELFLTQPAVTKHIKRLEESLNIQLFERIGNKVVLTPAGHKYFSYAKELIEKYEHGMIEFESWKQGYNRKLIIAAAPQIASSFLPSLLRKFMEENPDLEVVINVLKSYDIGEEISSGRADVGLTRVLPIQSNIRSEIIHKDSVVLAGPNECKGLTEQMMLHKYRLIIHNHPDYWDMLLDEVKKYYPAIRTMTVNQIEVTKRFIEEGLGVSYLPLTVVKDEISRNKMAAIKPDKIMLPTSLTYVLTKVVTDEVRLFIKFLQDAISKV